MYHKLDDYGHLWVYPDDSDSEDGRVYPASEDDVREYLFGAGFALIDPRLVGALTSGDIFTDGDMDEYREGDKLWWHEAYAVEDMAEAVRGGGLRLQRGD